MKYSANGLNVGHNNKKPTTIKSVEQHGINWMDKPSRFALAGFHHALGCCSSWSIVWIFIVVETMKEN